MTTHVFSVQFSRDVFEFDVIGDPAPQGSKRAFVNPRNGRAVMVESSKAKLLPWRQEIAKAAMAYGLKPWEGAVVLELTFYLPRRKVHGNKTGAAIATKRPDVLKLTRAAEDALTGIAYRDDAQITTEILRKRIADVGTPARLVVRIGSDE